MRQLVLLFCLQVVFTSLALFNVLLAPINSFPCKCGVCCCACHCCCWCCCRQGWLAHYPPTEKVEFAPYGPTHILRAILPLTHMQGC